MECTPPVTFVHRDSPERNTGVGCHAVHQEIAPTQGSNPGLPILGKFFTTWATKEAPAPDYQTQYPKFSLPILLYFPKFILRSREQRLHREAIRILIFVCGGR